MTEINSGPMDPERLAALRDHIESFEVGWPWQSVVEELLAAHDYWRRMAKGDGADEGSLPSPNPVKPHTRKEG